MVQCSGHQGLLQDLPCLTMNVGVGGVKGEIEVKGQVKEPKHQVVMRQLEEQLLRHRQKLKGTIHC